MPRETKYIFLKQTKFFISKMWDIGYFSGITKVGDSNNIKFVDDIDKAKKFNSYKNAIKAKNKIYELNYHLSRVLEILEVEIKYTNQ